jgi:hypothetical protein
MENKGWNYTSRLLCSVTLSFPEIGSQLIYKLLA